MAGRQEKEETAADAEIRKSSNPNLAGWDRFKDLSYSSLHSINHEPVGVHRNLTRVSMKA